MKMAVPTLMLVACATLAALGWTTSGHAAIAAAVIALVVLVLSAIRFVRKVAYLLIKALLLGPNSDSEQRRRDDLTDPYKN
jgi:hypothetical protein